MGNRKSQVERKKYLWKKHLLSWLERLPHGEGKAEFVDESLLAFPLFSLLMHADRPLLVVSPALPLAERVKEDLTLLSEVLSTNFRIGGLPEGSTRSQALAGSDAPRAEVLYRTLTDPPALISVSLSALLAPAPAPRKMRDSGLLLRPGMEISIPALAEKLLEMEYDDELEVVRPGEFARRGGIVDLFSPSEKLPARIEFWGDVIDSIRLFRPDTQISCAPAEEYRVILRSGSAPAGEDPSSDSADFADYFEDPLLAVIHPAECMRHLEQFGTAENLARWETLLKRAGLRKIFFPDAAEAAALEKDLSAPACYPAFAHIVKSLPEGAEESCSELARQLGAAQIRSWCREGCHVVLLGRSTADAAYIRSWLEEAGLLHPQEEDGVLQIDHSPFPRGVFLPEENLAVLTEQELFSIPGKVRSSTASRSRAEDLPSSARGTDGGMFTTMGELEEGGYAVHINYGICLYRGLKTLTSSDGGTEEVLELEFADDTIVNVPVWQADCVSRYIGSKKTAPPLSRITTSRWNRTKSEAASRIRDLAMDMLRMQALRSASRGEACPPDDLNQRLFEQAFPFQETADQLKAASEIKQDMESEKPMDRLLCGDVGYGKTELAMRAAHKCVMNGRQVAMLVPTTVLAQQHYFSFLERFSGTPVVIETLSRFKSKAEQTKIVQRLKEGSVDIVIGTHRLLQADIAFKNLGLIVIDEEQRFGVLHKERLKRLRATVDVLTMTATPIPRTLYFSLAGLRDLSTLMSAPVQRLPIQTVVAQSDDSVLVSAIRRELQRGGQVYYLHNRVATIEKEAQRLSRLFPEARIGIGHGRMDEEELENTMQNFIEGKMDILVCTTIIESGLDIPNANTIIIDRADRFGLAELYQLRGRVGRWVRQAYAYFLLPKSGILTGDARKRISAIRRYTHLGAGFQLALRDLEIRGSGNILGAEQSGQINAVGFHLYCSLLRACISSLKGERPERRKDCSLNLDFLRYSLLPPPGGIGAGFPREFIGSDRMRLEAYRRLAAVASEEQLEEFSAELKDRFGPLPPETERLLLCRRIRLAAADAGVDSVSCREDRIYLERAGSILKPDGFVPRLPPGLPAEKKLGALHALMTRLFPRL